MRIALVLVFALASGCARSVPSGDAGVVLPSGDAGPRPPDAGPPGPADPREFCINSRFWQCRRDLAGGRITDAEYQDCLLPISAACEGAVWPAGCAPTNTEAEACIIELSRADRVDVLTEVIVSEPPCQLCP